MSDSLTVLADVEGSARYSPDVMLRMPVVLCMDLDGNTQRYHGFMRSILCDFPWGISTTARVDLEEWRYWRGSRIPLDDPIESPKMS